MDFYHGLSFTANQLTSSTSDRAACPNDPVVFTCSVGRTSLRWAVDPPPGYVVSYQISQIILYYTGTLLPVGVEGFMFQAAVADTSNGSLTSTLTTITEVSRLNGSVVSCNGDMTESLTINVASE